MKVVICEPGKMARVDDIVNDLSTYQKLVDGLIECLYPFEDDVCIICNDEGKLRHLPFNRGLYDDRDNLIDVIAGTFLVVGIDGDDFTDLTDKQIERFLFKFQYPEIVIVNDGQVFTIEYEP